MVKQTDLAQVTPQPKQAQMAENSSVAISSPWHRWIFPSKSSREKYMLEPWQYVSWRRVVPCEDWLQSLLGFASSRPCIGIVGLLTHPAPNTIRLLCSLSSRCRIWLHKGERIHSVGFCSAFATASPGCVRDERFVCECRTNRQSTSSLVQLPLSSNFRNWESFKHQKPILGMWAHLLLLH